MFNIGRQIARSIQLSQPATNNVRLQLGQSRNFWGWLNAIFNRYDPSRVKEVGPDRACAEWLLRCGAKVKWANSSTWLDDYNSLPVTTTPEMILVGVDATDSAVMELGFMHFQNLPQLREMIYHKASYFNDDCIGCLNAYCARSLKRLEISSCGNVSADGIRNLTKLKELEHLLLYDFPQISVAQRLELLNELKLALPRCDVQFPYSQASEQSKKTEEK